MKLFRLSLRLLTAAIRERAVSLVRESVSGEDFLGTLRAPPHEGTRPANFIFERPAFLPFSLQVAENVDALDAIVARYRGFLPFAQNL